MMRLQTDLAEQEVDGGEAVVQQPILRDDDLSPELKRVMHSIGETMRNDPCPDQDEMPSAPDIEE